MFYRHYRPHWYSRDKHELVPLSNGGVTFLINTVDSNTYEYWIYICPADIPFSGKQAVRTLKKVVESGTSPWDTIQSDGSNPIIDLLVKSVINETNGFPSDVAKEVLQYFIINETALRKKLKAESSSAKHQYEAS